MNETDSTLRMLFEDFHQSVLPNIADTLIPRDLNLGSIRKPAVGNMVKVIVGMRRTGKTFRLYQEMLHLINQGISADRICYLNFDDDRLRPYDSTFIGHALEVFFAMHPNSRREGTYVFFDEIQDVDQWSLAIRRIIDTEKVSLYLTGSSSRLLSDDIATELRGRSIAYELLPFSFREYVRANNHEPVNLSILQSKEVASQMKAALESYLVEGGFPSIIGLDSIERTQVLQSYAQLTVARDVIERQRMSNASFARSLARTAIASSARDVSISRIDNKAKSSGYTPGRAKIAEILDAFEDAHLVYQVYDFSYSAQKIRLGGLKLYANDPGLYWATIPASNDGMAFSLETAVYLELRRRRRTGRLGDIAMLKLPSGKEVDFIEGDAVLDTANQLVQVSVSLENEATQKREVSALEEAMSQHPDAKALIITFDEEGEINTNTGTIQVIPAWKWLLDFKPSL